MSVCVCLSVCVCVCVCVCADLEDDQADLVNGDAADQTTDAEEVVRKPRKKK